MAVAAVRALTEVLKGSSGTRLCASSRQRHSWRAREGICSLTSRALLVAATTMMEVQQELKEASRQLQSFSSAISLASGCELFAHFVTRTFDDIPVRLMRERERVYDLACQRWWLQVFERCKAQLIERGEKFKHKTGLSRQRISAFANAFIRDRNVRRRASLRVLAQEPPRMLTAEVAAGCAGARVLACRTLGADECPSEWQQTIQRARDGIASRQCWVRLAERRQLEYVADAASMHRCSYDMARRLEKAGIPVTLIMDSAVAHFMEKVLARSRETPTLTRARISSHTRVWLRWPAQDRYHAGRSRGCG